ncbi:hypothetical protein [Acinetobacter sp. YH01024]|uniref:hypothetical protein n=1 Tax=Acinetobacter sp. YH01024 TaxID=2601037 RepID=UPI0015D0DDC0|nr:hypothetical protein [Acinetobacter sp. YH01024]
MKKFNFTIFILDLSTSNICIEDRLFEVGCNDALVCSTNDDIYLDFIREAETLDRAIQSAIKDIEMASAKGIQINVNNKPYTIVI